MPGGITEQTEQVFANLRAILEAAGTSLDQIVKTTVFLQSLDDFAAMNEVYARHVGEHAAGALDGRGREAPLGRTRRDRGCRTRPTERRPSRSVTIRRRSASTRTSSAAPYATRCSGSSRRTRTSSSPASTSAGLRLALEPHGRVEDLVVAGRPVGLRLFPRDREVRALAPAGIEFAPPRRERSTGPGRHDFEIVVDPAATVEDDLARRDFTSTRWRDISTTASSSIRSTAAATSNGGVLRTVSPHSFAEDPLRLVRGLRFVSQLDFDARRGDAARRCATRRASVAARLGRAHRRRPRRRRDGRAVEAAARRASRAGRSRSRATRACSSRSCRSSSARSASTRSAATTT